MEERALAVTESALGLDHRDIAIRLNNLAATYHDLGRHADALPLQQRAQDDPQPPLAPHTADPPHQLSGHAPAHLDP